MSADFSGSEEIVKFAEAVQNYLRNGKRKEDGNQPRRVEADGKAVQDVRNGSNEGRESQESEIFSKLETKFGVPVENVSREDIPGTKKGSKSVTGFYNPKTGSVSIVPENIKSVREAEVTYLHEVVGHKGMHEMLGE